MNTGHDDRRRLGFLRTIKEAGKGSFGSFGRVIDRLSIECDIDGLNSVALHDGKIGPPVAFIFIQHLGCHKKRPSYVAVPDFDSSAALLIEETYKSGDNSVEEYRREKSRKVGIFEWQPRSRNDFHTERILGGRSKYINSDDSHFVSEISKPCSSVGFKTPISSPSISKSSLIVFESIYALTRALSPA